MFRILCGVGLTLTVLGCEGTIAPPAALPPGTPPVLPGPGPVRYVCDQQTWGATSLVRRLTAVEYAHAVRDVFGVDGSPRYPGAYGAATTGFSTEPGIGAIGEQGVEQLVSASEDVALAIAPRVGALVPCAATGTAACAATFLDTVGRRAFRRALVASERTALLAIYSAERADGATFSEAVAVMSAALVQMPGFLYVIEAPAAPGVDRARTGLELATRLAFHFWSSVPDDALLARAESGQLETKAAVLEEAKRLFADPKADRAFSRFVREWTQTKALTLTDKDPAAFPELTQALVDSMNGSFDRFAADQLRSGGTLKSLLRSSEVHVDRSLAGFLGVPAPASGWAKAALEPARHSGLMTQPAAMAALAHSSETSYVFRGRVVRTRLLCEELGAPPPNAAVAFASLPKPADPTARELSAIVQSDAACASCHRLLDPAGLALEHFDAIGRYRDAYPSGKAIDTAGALVGAGDPLPFDGPIALFEKVAGLQKSADCLAKQVFRFTASRSESVDDHCALQQLSDALAASGNRLDAVFLAATQTDGFMYRRGE